MIDGTCYALPGGVPGLPGTTTPATGGDCPAGQVKDPFLGKCWPNPLGGGGSTTPGPTTPGIDPISILGQLVELLKPPGQTVIPGVGPVAPESDVFGKYGLGIAALIGLCAVGGVVYYVRKNRSQQFADQDYSMATGDVVPGISGEDILLQAVGSWRQDRDEDYYEQESAYGYTPNRRRGRKAGKRSRR